MNEQERSEFRRFVREHHPDRGGDPEVFMAGLARFGVAAPVPPTADDQDGRHDAPVEVVPPLPLATRVAVALIRTWHRRRRHRVE